MEAVEMEVVTAVEMVAAATAAEVMAEVMAEVAMEGVEMAAETAEVAMAEATAERRSPHRHSIGPRASHPRDRICNPECNHPSQPRASPSSSTREYRCIASHQTGMDRQTEGSCNQSECSLMSSD